MSGREDEGGAAGADGSTVRGYVGDVLRTYRRRARLTREELDAKLFEPALRVGDVEEGRVAVTPRFLFRAESVLGADGLLVTAAGLLAHERHRAGVTHELETELLTRSIRVCCWSPHVVPDLLQTPEYTRALLRGRLPRPGEDVVERAVADLTERRELVVGAHRSVLWFILDEAVLYRNIGGPEVMGQQLDLLAEHARRRRLMIQVVPLGGLDRYPGPVGPAVLFQIREGECVAAVEDHDGTRIVHEGDAAVSACFSDLCGHGLDAGRSAELIGQAAKEVSSHFSAPAG